ncbi:MAG TPA: hypothetical protein PLZ57_11605 [Pseudobdellovibrionaceae bacterium]|nr:hypothetical protein [Pseudobdellovibrionaceae bacterium]
MEKTFSSENSIRPTQRPSALFQIETRVSGRMARLLLLGLTTLAMNVSTPAKAQEQCVTSFPEAERSSSALLKKVAAMVKGRNFTNRTNGTHLTFGSGRFNFQYLSTDDSGRLVRQTGIAKLCDRNGTLSLTTPDGRDLTVTSQGQCFQVSPGGMAAAFISTDARTFCPGQMPRAVATACARHPQCASANNLGPSGSPAGTTDRSVAGQPSTATSGATR